MRTIIFSITDNGIVLANRIAEQLEGCTVLVKGRDFNKLYEVVDENFKIYDALIIYFSSGYCGKNDCASHCE